MVFNFGLSFYNTVLYGDCKISLSAFNVNVWRIMVKGINVYHNALYDENRPHILLFLLVDSFSYSTHSPSSVADVASVIFTITRSPM